MFNPETKTYLKRRFDIKYSQLNELKLNEFAVFKGNEDVTENQSNIIMCLDYTDTISIPQLYIEIR